METEGAFWPGDPGELGQAQLIQFFIPLPDPVAVPDGATYFALAFDECPALLRNAVGEGLPPAAVEALRAGQTFVHACLQRTQTQTNPLGTAFEAIEEFAGPYAVSNEFYRRLHALDPDCNATTVAIVTTVVDAGDPTEEIWTALHRAVGWLREVVSAYRSNVGLPVRLPSMGALPPFIAYVFRPVGSSVFNPPAYLYRPHHWLPGEMNIPDVDPAELDAWLNWQSHSKGWGHPTAIHNELLAEAYTTLERWGEQGPAIVLLETACEVLGDGMVGMLLYEHNTPIEDARPHWERSFGWRIRNVPRPLVGGNWQDSGNGAIARWAEDLSDLRNRTVHAGYRPTEAEMNCAFDAARGFARHVHDRLLAAHHKCPHSCLALLGPQQVLEAGKMTRRMRDALDEETESGRVWAVGFAEWYEALRAPRKRRGGKRW